MSKGLKEMQEQIAISDPDNFMKKIKYKRAQMMESGEGQ